MHFRLETYKKWRIVFTTFGRYLFFCVRWAAFPSAICKATVFFFNFPHNLIRFAQQTSNRSRGWRFVRFIIGWNQNAVRCRDRRKWMNVPNDWICPVTFKSKIQKQQLRTLVASNKFAWNLVYRINLIYLKDVDNGKSHTEHRTLCNSKHIYSNWSEKQRTIFNQSNFQFTRHTHFDAVQIIINLQYRCVTDFPALKM